MNDLFTNGAHYPGNHADEGKCGAEQAHRIYFKDHDKPLINECKSLSNCIYSNLSLFVQRDAKRKSAPHLLTILAL